MIIVTHYYLNVYFIQNNIIELTIILSLQKYSFKFYQIIDLCIILNI